MNGITYFEYEVNVTARPIYHRAVSCGNASKTVNNNTFDKDRKKKYVRRCLVERLIYDKIYTNILHAQDVAHMLELARMQRLFHDYFPEVNGIYVNVQGTTPSSIFPVKVQISTFYEDMTSDIEVYTKHQNIVHCTRHHKSTDAKNRIIRTKRFIRSPLGTSTRSQMQKRFYIVCVWFSHSIETLNHN